MNYNPNAPDVVGPIFGLPYTEDEASIIILPVPWDVTTSYHSGTSKGPQAILDASTQLDLELSGINDAWKIPIWMATIPNDILVVNKVLRQKIKPFIHSLENDKLPTENFQEIISEVNSVSLNIKNRVKKQASKYLNNNKIVGVLGGEHSVSLGLLEALADTHEEFGILQIDAHKDLRKAYQEFEYSHASIMYNALALPQVNKLVQVGGRDYCPEESNFVKKASGRVEVFYDVELKSKMYAGVFWDKICADIIDKLPEYVYISFDIDGLTPHLCPGTGTPVPGGLEYQEAIYLIRMLAKSGRKIIGFDLCEVAPRENDNEWNGNVGARVLYNLCCWAQ